jgi:class 3 adenylate cyclase
LENNASLAKELLTNMRNALPFCNTVEEFIHIYADSIYQVTGLRTLIHQWVGSSAIAIAHSGLDENHWEIFKNNPFNLASNAKNAMGPTVVAFRESKSSYLKDWNEISDRFHPKTISILSKIETKSLIAVPVKSGSDTFVITLLSRMDETPKDPGINRVIEATEAIFDAAITVLKQKSSILALGNISNRLIGDNEVRQQILAAARQSELPTIIGSPRSSLILLIDLVGSSYLPVDSLSKAKSYGVFYDEVNATVGKKIGGKVRKTIGDAVVITWDNSQFDPRDQLRFFENLMEVLDLANATAKRVGCDGVRSVLHFGHYFFGLIGTSSFGQIDVIGLGIDEVCKLETKIKTVEIRGEAISIALSPNAVEYLGYQSQSKLEKLGFSLIALGPNSTESIWCCNKRKQLSTDVA